MTNMRDSDLVVQPSCRPGNRVLKSCRAELVGTSTGTDTGANARSHAPKTAPYGLRYQDFQDQSIEISCTTWK